MYQRPPQPQACNFLHRLPLELREAIYSYLTIDKPAYTCFILRAKGYVPVERVGFQKPPVLSWVCRQIRTEALSIWYGRNVIEVTLDDEIALDGLYLRSCLRGIGEGITYIRRFVIRHKVDCFLHATPDCPIQRHTQSPAPRDLDAVHGWRESHFRVLDNGSVKVDCKPMTAQYFGKTCVCPLSHRLESVKTMAINGLWDCPLSRSLCAFLNLVEQECLDIWGTVFASGHPQQELEMVRQCTEGSYWDRDLLLRIAYGLGHYPLDRLRTKAGWPTCPSCGLRQWMLQGPKVESERARQEMVMSEDGCIVS